MFRLIFINFKPELIHFWQKTKTCRFDKILENNNNNNKNNTKQNKTKTSNPKFSPTQNLELFWTMPFYTNIQTHCR